MTQQQTTTTEVVETEVVDDLPKEAGPANLVLHESADLGQPVDMGVLQSLGFITPIATPEQLRAAFAYKQRMFAAILDEGDYLYTVTWTSDKKSVQRVTSRFSEAKELAAKFENLGAELNAKPKKSGIVKLARALGITASRRIVKGLPEDPVAQFSYVEYEAVHEGTGKSEIGVGWCDKGERGGKISTHDVIATADTRAYNRAVLRLAGFGDVSADEIVAGASQGDDLPVEVPEPPKAKTMELLPEVDSDEVKAAARAWATAIVERGSKFEPEAKQDTRNARELRAQARRGAQRAAQQLGVLGLRWEGTASDGMGYPPFSTGAPPVTVKDIEALRAAAAESAPAPSNGEQEKKGWDLSGKGSGKDDEGLPTDLPDLVKDDSIPGPSPTAETITTKQAKNISLLLKEIFSSKDEMKAWLKTNCHADSTIHIRSNQYEPIIKALTKRAESKE